MALQKTGIVWQIAGFVDDDPSAANLHLAERLGAKVIGPVSSLAVGGAAAVVAIGSPTVRRAVVERLGRADLVWPALVHPDSTVGQDVRLGDGVVIAAGARLSTNIEVGHHVHIDQNATVGHDARLGDYSRLNPQACVSGSVTLEDGVLVGAGATVLPGLVVGANTVVGAGAVVVRSARNGSVVKGIPAK